MPEFTGDDTVNFQAEIEDTSEIFDPDLDNPASELYTLKANEMKIQVRTF